MSLLNLNKAYHFSISLRDGEPVLRVTDDSDKVVLVEHMLYPPAEGEVASFSLFPVSANAKK